MRTIKAFIIKFLGVDKELKELRTLVKEAHEKLSHHQNSIERDLREIHKCFNVGVDIHPLGKDSWAVICTVDKQNNAKLRYIDLRGANVREIEEFLYRSTPRHSNKFIDSANPPFWKRK